jgi:hypothetical protein
MQHAQKKRQMHTQFRSENLKGRELGISRHRWEDNIKIDLKKISCECVVWIHLAKNRVQG